MLVGRIHGDGLNSGATDDALAEGLQVAGNVDALQPLVVEESLRTQILHRGRQLYACEGGVFLVGIGALHESTVANVAQALACEGERLELRAVEEGTLCNGVYRGRNGQMLDAIGIEGGLADVLQAFREVERLQVKA